MHPLHGYNFGFLDFFVSTKRKKMYCRPSIGNKKKFEKIKVFPSMFDVCIADITWNIKDFFFFYLLFKINYVGCLFRSNDPRKKYWKTQWKWILKNSIKILKYYFYLFLDKKIVTLFYMQQNDSPLEFEDDQRNAFDEATVTVSTYLEQTFF